MGKTVQEHCRHLRIPVSLRSERMPLSRGVSPTTITGSARSSKCANRGFHDRLHAEPTATIEKPSLKPSHRH